MPPVWPTVEGAQQMGMHLDIAVEDLAAGAGVRPDVGSSPRGPSAASRRQGDARPCRPSVLPISRQGLGLRMSKARTLRTKELSKRTWADFERLFSQGNGWDFCWCLAYQFGGSGGRGRRRPEIGRAHV